MAFRMSGPTQQQGQQPYRYVGNRMRAKPAPEPYVAPAPAPVAAPGPGTGGGLGSGHYTGGGGGVDNSDLDGNYDAMMERIKAGRAGAGFSRGQPISADNPGNHAPGAVAGYDGQPQGSRLRGAPMTTITPGQFGNYGMDSMAGQPYQPLVPSPNTNLGLNGRANGTYGGYAEGGVVEDGPDAEPDNDADDLSSALAVVKDVENYRRQKHGLLQGEPESENVDDRRENDTSVDRRSAMDRLSAGNGERTLLGTSPVRGDLEDTGVRNKGPIGFADGGAVDDPEGDGGLQLDEPQGPQEMQGPEDDRGPILPRMLGDAGDAIKGAGQRFMAYLQGADASHPDVAKEYEAKVDPDGTRDEGERKVLAVAAAAQDDGPDAAAALSASYRQKYDAYRGMAAGALAHGDLDKAAEAATKAYPNVLDGADVKFVRQGNGFTATVTKPGKDPESFPLSTNQFDEFVKGNAGQYDHVTDLGADVLLKDLSQSGGGAIPAPGAENTPMPGAAAAGSPAPLDQWIDDQGIQRGGNPADHPEGKRTGTPVAARAPSKFNNPYRDMGISDQVAARGMARFPMVSQNGQRLEYMQKLEDSQNKTENEALKATEAARGRIDAAEAAANARRYSADQGVTREGVRQEGQNRVAETRAAAYTAVNNLKSGVRSEGDKLKAQVALQKLAADSTNAQAKNTALLLGKEIMNIPLGSKLPPAHQKMLDQLINPPAQAAPSAPGQTAPQPTGGGVRVPGKNPGEWYVQRSDGKFYKEKQ